MNIIQTNLTMRKLLVTLAATLATLAGQAQTTLDINTPFPCMVSVISEEEAAGAEWGWWSVWHEQKTSNDVYATADNGSGSYSAQILVSPGYYTIVVFDFDGYVYDLSDGVVLESYYVGPSKSASQRKIIRLQKSDFIEWNCLSCPWLYVFDGQQFVRQEEIIKDVAGKSRETTTTCSIDARNIVNGQLRLRVQEEKEETSYLDRITLLVNGQPLQARAEAQCAADKLATQDEQYLELRKGEHIELVFDIPAEAGATPELRLESRGFYEPEQEYLDQIYETYLRR